MTSLYDDDEPHPAQDNHGEMMICTEDEDFIQEKESGYHENGFWERRRGIPAICHQIPSQITDLEFILQPLKLLRGVGKARINLTVGGEKDEDMRRIVRECQDAMMSSGARDELDLQFMDWCTDPSLPWGLETLFSDEHPSVKTLRVIW